MAECTELSYHLKQCVMAIVKTDDLRNTVALLCIYKFSIMAFVRVRVFCFDVFVIAA